MSADRPTPAAIGGYAPGHYHCWCVGCGSEFLGDKRATQCFRCASDKSKPEPAAIETALRELRLLEKAASRMATYYGEESSSPPLFCKLEADRHAAEAAALRSFIAWVEEMRDG